MVDTHKLHEMDNEVLRTAGTLLNSLHGEAWIADREERSIYEDGMRRSVGRGVRGGWVWVGGEGEGTPV